MVFIGPRPFRHGNTGGKNFWPNAIVKFQLGHVLSDMEISKMSKNVTTVSVFQLGHVLSDMEISWVAEGARLPPRFQLGHVLSDMEILQAYTEHES